MKFTLKFQLSVIAKSKTPKKILIKINMLTKHESALKIHHRRSKRLGDFGGQSPGNHSDKLTRSGLLIMGEVVRLSDYQKNFSNESSDALRDGLVPIEFALGDSNRENCLARIAEYGVHSIHVRMVNSKPDAFLYLIGVRDAIFINKKILECEDISETEICQRIDLIQMMENMNLSLMDTVWESISSHGQESLH